MTLGPLSKEVDCCKAVDFFPFVWYNKPRGGKMIKVILFDFDGVLTTDSTGSLTICKYISQVSNIEFELLNSEYRKYNGDLLYGKVTHVEIWEELCKRIGVSIPYSILMDSFINTPIDNQMIELVYKLKSTGYKIGMITDNKRDRIDCIIEHYDWCSLFDVVIVSADVGSGKNKNIIFDRALEKLNLSADKCVFIDNQKKNLIVPQSMGMRTIYYNHETRDFDSILKKLQEMNVIR